MCLKGPPPQIPELNGSSSSSSQRLDQGVALKANCQAVAQVELTSEPIHPVVVNSEMKPYENTVVSKICQLKVVRVD